MNESPPIKSKRGGFRPGAGRKSNAAKSKAERIRRQIEESIREIKEENGISDSSEGRASNSEASESVAKGAGLVERRTGENPDQSGGSGSGVSDGGLGAGDQLSGEGRDSVQHGSAPKDSGGVGVGETLHEEGGSGSPNLGGDRGQPGPESAGDPDPDATRAELRGITFDEQVKRLRDPVYFVRANCLRTLDRWQVKLLGDARTPGRTALRGANGIGKTVIIACLILFFLSTVRNCRVVIVSGVFRQLKMMVDHLQSLLKNFPGWRVLRGVHELHSPFPENKAIWFSTDSPGAAQGQHSVVEAVNLDEDSSAHGGVTELEKQYAEARAAGSALVLIRDECRDIPEEVKGATDTFGATWTFDFSCPGMSIGWFYEIFAQLGGIYRLHHVKAQDSSHIPAKQIEEMATIHGPKSARYKNSVEAEFSDVDIKNLITLEQVNKCLHNPPPWRHSGVVVAGVDFSAAKKGGDECVVGHRMGNKVYPLFIVPLADNEMEVVGRVLQHLRQIKARWVYGDAGNMGGTMLARLEEICAGDESITIIRENFGGNALDTSNFCYDRAAEMWLNMARKIEDCHIILPNDPRLVAQLVNRPTVPRSDGLIQLLSKTKMTKSPDRADTLALVLQGPAAPIASAVFDKGSKTFWSDFKNGRFEESDGNEKQHLGFTSGGKRLGRG